MSEELVQSATSESDEIVQGSKFKDNASNFKSGAKITLLWSIRNKRDRKFHFVEYKKQKTSFPYLEAPLAILRSHQNWPCHKAALQVHL